MEWQKLTPDNLPEMGTWILISDGKDWRRVYVTAQMEFVERKTDMTAYWEGITHWCKVVLP